MFNNISLGQYIPAPSILHKLDSRSKIITTFLLVPLVFLAKNPVQLGLLFLTANILLILSRINIRNYIEAMRPFIFIIIVTSLLQIIFIKGNILIDLHLFFISIEGLQAAVALTIRLITIIILVNLFTMTTTPGAITGGMEKIMTPLNKLGFPVHELIMIITISLRFIPIFVEEASRIRKAQMCRGAVFMYGSLAQRATSIISVLVPLFNSCFSRARDLAQAMESRCYQGRESHSHLYKSQMKMMDYCYIFILAGIVMVTIFCK